MTRTLEDILRPRSDMTVIGSISRCEFLSNWMDVLRTDSELLPLLQVAWTKQDGVTHRLLGEPVLSCFAGLIEVVL